MHRPYVHHHSPSAPSKPAGLFSPRTANKENSRGSGGSAASAALLLAAATAQAAPLQDHQPLSLLATPSAPMRARPSLPGLAPLPPPPFAPLSRSSSGAMPMEEDEVAATPAYSTTPASYSLFSGGGLCAGAALFGQPEPFGAGASVFRSALETPTAPAVAGALHAWGGVVRRS